MDHDHELAQLRWQECVDQAVQDIRLVVDAANDLYRSAGDAERATAAVQYHQFSEGVDTDELIRTANTLKHEVGRQVSALQSAIGNLQSHLYHLGDVASNAQHSVE